METGTLASESSNTQVTKMAVIGARDSVEQESIQVLCEWILEIGHGNVCTFPIHCPACLVNHSIVEKFYDGWIQRTFTHVRVPRPT